MLGVMLARLAGMVSGMRRMAMRRMGVMTGHLVGVGLVMLGSLAMVLGGVLMMLGRGVMVLDDLFLGHDDLHGGECARPARPARRAAILGGRCCAAVTARCQSRWIVGELESSVRRDAEAALPEFAAAPLAHVAAELVLGPHELGVVVLAAHRSAAAAGIVALRELRAIRGMDGKGDSVVEDDALDIGDAWHAERREFLPELSWQDVTEPGAYVVSDEL